MPGADDEWAVREAELEREARELRAYSQHAIAFALGFAFALAGAFLARVAPIVPGLGFLCAGAAWCYSGVTAWRGGVHMFGGFRAASVGRAVNMRLTRRGARAVGVALILLGAMTLLSALFMVAKRATG